jgi:hypothetical protein
MPPSNPFLNITDVPVPGTNQVLLTTDNPDRLNAALQSAWNQQNGAFGAALSLVNNEVSKAHTLYRLLDALGSTEILREAYWAQTKQTSVIQDVYWESGGSGSRVPVTRNWRFGLDDITLDWRKQQQINKALNAPLFDTRISIQEAAHHKFQQGMSDEEFERYIKERGILPGWDVVDKLNALRYAELEARGLNKPIGLSAYGITPPPGLPGGIQPLDPLGSLAQQARDAINHKYDVEILRTMHELNALDRFQYAMLKFGVPAGNAVISAYELHDGRSFEFHDLGQDLTPEGRAVRWANITVGGPLEVFIAAGGMKFFVRGARLPKGAAAGAPAAAAEGIAGKARAPIGGAVAKAGQLADEGAARSAAQAAAAWQALLNTLGACRKVGAPCFAAGTPVRTPEGSKRIELIRPGDRVLSRDEFNRDGPLEAKVVEDNFNSLARIWVLRIAGQEIRTTKTHPFFARERGWVPVERLSPGDLIAGEECGWHPVEEVIDTGVYETVYNFRVADFHTYFIGTTRWGWSAWAHNTCWRVEETADGVDLINPDGTRRSYPAKDAAHKQQLLKDLQEIADQRNDMEGLKPGETTTPQATVPPSAQEPRVLQGPGSHTLSEHTRRELGLSKEEAKAAIEKLKKENLRGNDDHNHKIYDNGDVRDATTNELIGNLFEQIHKKRK